MARRRRPHLPGATFHLTTRVQGREALFTPELRTAIVALLREQVVFSDIQLFAYVIMPNHLHLVLRQGQEPLWRFMQPFLRRTALITQRAHGREGHVFERRFRDHPCGNAEYIRNAIIYAHLNPVRPGLCDEPGDYPWSSHGAWANDLPAADGLPDPVSLELAAQLFASDGTRDRAGLALDYLKFLDWRRDCDRLQAEDTFVGVPQLLPVRPPVGYGNEDWVVHLTPGGVSGEKWSHSDPASPPISEARVDLEHLARGVVGSGRYRLDLSLVRSRWGGAAYVRARHEIIRRAAAVGYRGVEIAAFLRISSSAVYAVLAAERQRLLGSL